MQQPLSPKKYIQTRARTLPIYKCFVNKDWQTSGMADVFVMRRHVNGHLTAGVYLVDLFCLGIKDTFFFFNEDESEVIDKVPMRLFMEIDYTLAHNIIYAGHDFAMDFDIVPHKDFSITRYILEDDTDAIPLIEIHTGDSSGKPHLMVDSPGQYSEALAKLRKHAGEGNYRYTIGHIVDVDDLEDEDEFDELVSLDDYEIGTVSVRDAMYLDMQDLMDEEKVGGRASDERLTLQLEALLRTLRLLKPGVFEYDNITDMPEYTQYLEDPAEEMNGYDKVLTKEEEEQEVSRRTRVLEEILPFLDNSNNELVVRARELLTEYAGDMLVAVTIFESLLVVKNAAAQKEAATNLQTYAARYPYARLILAFGALMHADAVPGDFSDIYQSSEIREVFPEYDSFHLNELYMYWLSKMLMAIRAGDAPTAVRYYGLIADTEGNGIQLILAQSELFDLIEPIVIELVREEIEE